MSDLSETEALLFILDGLGKAASGCQALAHLQQRPQWFKVRDMLEAVRAQASILAQSSAPGRIDVLAQMERRRQKLKVVR